MKKSHLSYIPVHETYDKIKDLKALYKLSFPKEERKPFFMILQGVKKGVMEAFAVEEEGILKGLAFCILSDDLIVLDYLATNPRYRNEGLGSQILQDLREYFQRPILVEIESSLQDPDEMKVRRKNFYMRNGLYPNPYEITLFGVDMEMLSTSPVSFEQYKSVLDHYFGRDSQKWIRKTRDLPVFDPESVMADQAEDNTDNRS